MTRCEKGPAQPRAGAGPMRFLNMTRQGHSQCRTHGIASTMARTSQYSDSASEKAIYRHGLTPIARILGGGARLAGVERRQKIMGIGPVPATRNICARLEITPVTIPQRKGDPIVIDKDEHPRVTSRNWLLSKRRSVQAGQ